jgi:hypothetical protein
MSKLGRILGMNVLYPDDRICTYIKCSIPTFRRIYARKWVYLQHEFLSL